MSFVSLILWWVIATSLGIAAIVALEPLRTRRRVECPVSAPRRARSPARRVTAAPRT